MTLKVRTRLYTAIRITLNDEIVKGSMEHLSFMVRIVLEKLDVKANATIKSN